MGMLQEASEAYTASVEIWMELGQPVLETEPRAGLARTQLALNHLPLAAQSVEKILAHLDAGKTLDGTDDPARIYLSCYLVLDAVQDERATQLIAAAYELLNRRAASIREPSARQSFLENIPHNREIVALWKSSGNG
jgi:hypothetical protein